MKKINLFFLLVILVNTSVFAQLSGNKFYQKTKEGYYHFYYDQQYYLVAQDCRFKFFTRVIQHVKEKNVFDGFFTDYFNNNKIALTGTYKMGLKDGVFKNYYPNGKLRYEVTFVDDKITGKAYFFYDNGKPWLNIEIKDGTFFILEYWNPVGKQRVKEGNGVYEYKDWYWGYNVDGFEAVVYKGRIKNGLTNSNWNIFFSYPDLSVELYRTEVMNNGKFQRATLYRKPSTSLQSSILRLVPHFDDNRSVSFISKDCTIDDNQNFISFLEAFLNQTFAVATLPEDFKSKTVECKVVVDQWGRAIDVNSDVESPTMARNLDLVFKAIEYWIPSYKNKQTITDTLTINFNVDQEKEIPSFNNLKIKRNEEN